MCVCVCNRNTDVSLLKSLQTGSLSYTIDNPHKILDMTVYLHLLIILMGLAGVLTLCNAVHRRPARDEHVCHHARMRDGRIAYVDLNICSKQRECVRDELRKLAPTDVECHSNLAPCRRAHVATHLTLAVTETLRDWLQSIYENHSARRLLEEVFPNGMDVIAVQFVVKHACLPEHRCCHNPRDYVPKYPYHRDVSAKVTSHGIYINLDYADMLTSIKFSELNPLPEHELLARTPTFLFNNYVLHGAPESRMLSKLHPTWEKNRVFLLVVDRSTSIKDAACVAEQHKLLDVMCRCPLI